LKVLANSCVFEYNGHNMAAEQSTDNLSGHEQRFLDAYELYNDALFRHACMRISDREKAIDLVHDTYTKVWSYVRKGYDIEQFRPFLYKVLNNLIIDTYRKKKEASLDALLDIDGIDEGSFEELSESSAEALAATIDGRKAFELMAELPDVYKEVLILRFVDGLGPKEMSVLTEEKENVISVRIHRGLKLLRQKIEAQDEFADEKRKSAARKRAADKKTI